MHPQFVTKAAFTVVGMRIDVTPKSPEIPALWGKFDPHIDEIPHVSEAHVSYGIMDHPDQTMTNMVYMAGLPVEKVENLPAGMTRWELPAGRYAVFETTLTAISETFDAIFHHWLPTSGCQISAAPYFERYDESFDPADPNSTLSIYIPLIP